jgi:ThiF family
MPHPQNHEIRSGRFFAAALIAGEIFKKTWGIRRGRMLRDDGYSLWSGNASSIWADRDCGPESNGLRLPAVLLVGAGAVGNALAYVLANIETNGSYIVPIDDDEYDTTNLNRCVLAGTQDVGQSMVQVLASRLKEAGIDTFPFHGLLKDFLKDARVGLQRCTRDR